MNHSESSLTKSSLTAEQYGDIWSVDAPETFSPDAKAWMYESYVARNNEPFQEYSRPVYNYVTGYPEELAPREESSMSLIFSGNRWFVIHLQSARDSTASEYWSWRTANYHGMRLVSLMSHVSD